MNLNKVMIIGNLTRDPETRNLPSGQSVSSFSVATNRRWKDAQTGEPKEASEFHNIVAWGKLADICNQYLKKGSKVYLEGRLQTRSWDDQNGNKKYRTEIVANNLIMLDRAGSVPGTKSEAPAPTKKDEKSAEEEISVEDIPF